MLSLPTKIDEQRDSSSLNETTIVTNYLPMSVVRVGGEEKQDCESITPASVSILPKEIEGLIKDGDADLEEQQPAVGDQEKEGKKEKRKKKKKKKQIINISDYVHDVEEEEKTVGNTSSYLHSSEMEVPDLNTDQNPVKENDDKTENEPNTHRMRKKKKKKKKRALNKSAGEEEEDSH